MSRPLDISECTAFADCMGIHATDSALLVEIEGEELWIPFSQIHPDSEVDDPDQMGILVISNWIAEQKGLL
jgi:hypothetical protein